AWRHGPATRISTALMNSSNPSGTNTTTAHDSQAAPVTADNTARNTAISTATTPEVTTPLRYPVSAHHPVMPTGYGLIATGPVRHSPGKCRPAVSPRARRDRIGTRTQDCMPGLADAVYRRDDQT